MDESLSEKDYRALAAFRLELRHFLRFSESAARQAGLTPQQHQALLAIRGGDADGMLVGALAEKLMLRSHSVSELVDRLERRGLVARIPTNTDKRQVRVALTDDARALLASLSASHRTELRRVRPLLRRLLEAL